MGLSLCKSLIELMGGRIWLDESYHRGIEGYPGTCFVIDLNMAPQEMYADHSDDESALLTESRCTLVANKNCSNNDSNSNDIKIVETSDDETSPAPGDNCALSPTCTSGTGTLENDKENVKNHDETDSAISTNSSPRVSFNRNDAKEHPQPCVPPLPPPVQERAALPENLSVLVVDDDTVVRKLLKRSLRRIALTWSISLSQGTGMGLSLCKSLIELMGGRIWLDESYHRGIEGYPGTCFVIDLNMAPQEVYADHSDNESALLTEESCCTLVANKNCSNNDNNINEIKAVETSDDETSPAAEDNCALSPTRTSGTGTLENDMENVKNHDETDSAISSNSSPRVSFDRNDAKEHPQPCVPPLPPPVQKRATLPENLSVLVVDDDMVVRKLLKRSLSRIAPTWSIQEAANGETALRLVDDAEANRNRFSLIFMDQYMASIEKQLLGTETVQALRARGVQSRICGLSANDMKDSFLLAGADCFMPKPFACEKHVFLEQILHVWYGSNTTAPSRE